MSLENKLETLLEFISEAHRNTYAAPNEVRKENHIEANLSKHKAYSFEKENWKYHDEYCGGHMAPGREVIFFNDTPVWAMSYQGKHNTEYPDEFYKGENGALTFLRKALMNFDDELPFRGPVNFEEGDFKYTFEIDGDVEYFTGREAITFKGEEVFFQNVMGELVGKYTPFLFDN